MRIFILILTGILALCQCTEKQEPLPPDSIYHLSSQWERQDGEKMPLSALRGKVVVTAMIFTSCKTACPRLTKEMSAIAQKVGKADPDKLQYVLISIDPEHDNPAVMRSYLAQNNLDEDLWTFLRSNEKNTRELANVMAVKYKKITPMEFSHSNIISVYSPDGTLAYQQEGLTAESSDTVAKEINELLK